MIRRTILFVSTAIGITAVAFCGRALAQTGGASGGLTKAMLERVNAAWSTMNMAKVVAMSTDARWASPYYWAGFVLQGDWK
jgi:CHAT domain-containing protein